MACKTVAITAAGEVEEYLTVLRSTVDLESWFLMFVISGKES